MPRRPRVVPILEALAARTREWHSDQLRHSYRDLAAELDELLPLAVDPNPPAPRLTRRLALLEAASGHPPPTGVLHALDVLAIARRRSLL